MKMPDTIMTLVFAVLFAGCAGGAEQVRGTEAPPLERPMTLEERLAAPPDVAAAPADATTTASGLAYKVLRPGTGTAHPTAQSEVTVHYSGWMTNGYLFDASVKQPSPVTFPLNRVIKGWTEGLQLMVVGEMTRFWIPAKLAYGDRPARAGGPFGTLVFDVELFSFR